MAGEVPLGVDGVDVEPTDADVVADDGGGGHEAVVGLAEGILE